MVMLRTIAGVILITIGVIGLVLPVIPGIPLLLAGMATMGRDHPWLRPLIERAGTTLRSVLLVRRMPPALRVIGEAPNLEHRLPSWLSVVGAQLAAKVVEWASLQVAQYLRNNAEQFRRAVLSDQDGLTLSVSMSRVPGMDVLRQIARGHVPSNVQGTSWLRGEPSFVVIPTPVPCSAPLL